MSLDDLPDYTPPQVWTWDAENGGQWAGINRPISGATHDKDLPRGAHDFQLYSMATPNGVKVTTMFEELLEAGHTGADYDAWLIRIGEGDQFSSGFVDINPNSKIPALYHVSADMRIFETASIMMYLAERFGAFLPTSGKARTETMNWLFWQMGSAPYLGGGFGHFYAYAPKKMEYPIDRFAMEVKRQLHVLDTRLADREFINGDSYSIADMAIFPWYGALCIRDSYNAQEFLSVHEYSHVIRWANQLVDRPAVKRGVMVNKAWGDASEQLHNRHDASDFALRTEDKLQG